jgi:hypothetical protein
VSRQFGPLGVALILPLGGPPAVKSDGSVQLDQATRDAIVSSSSVLAAHPDVPLTLAATAETVDALDPATIDTLRSATANRQLSLTPFVQLHPSEWVSAGLNGELGRQLDLGAEDLTTAIGSPTASTYVADDRLTPDAARFLHGRGIVSMAVPDRALTGLDERVFNRTLTQPFLLRDSGGVEAVATDGALAAHVGSTGDPVIDANHLVADLSVLYFDDPPNRRAATIELPGEQVIDSRFLDAFLGALSPTTNRILQPMTLSTLFSTVPVVGDRGAPTGGNTPLTRDLQPAPSDDLSSYARRLGPTIADISSYRTMMVGTETSVAIRLWSSYDRSRRPCTRSPAR